MNKIILNCCPPAKIEMPSPALSALCSKFIDNTAIQSVSV